MVRLWFYLSNRIRMGPRNSFMNNIFKLILNGFFSFFSAITFEQWIWSYHFEYSKIAHFMLNYIIILMVTIDHNHIVFLLAEKSWVQLIKHDNNVNDLLVSIPKCLKVSFYYIRYIAFVTKLFDLMGVKLKKIVFTKLY